MTLVRKNSAVFQDFHTLLGPKNLPYVAYHTGMTLGAVIRYNVSFT
jgi:hypothetical protein